MTDTFATYSYNHDKPAPAKFKRVEITHGRYKATLSPNGEGVYAIFTVDGQVSRALQGRSYADMKKAKRFAMAAMKKAS